MTGAPSVRVRDVAVFIKGKKPSITLAAPSAGALPYVLIEGFGGTYKTYTNDPGCVRCRPDDTIVVSDGANTGLASTNHDGYLGSTLGAVRPDPSKVNPRYLFYFVHGNFTTLNTRTRGAAVPHLERDLLLDLEFALPSLPEQAQIAQTLDEVEALRRLSAQADERTSRIVGAMFVGMFGEPSANPKGWPTHRAGELMTLCEYGTSKKSSDTGPGVPILRMNNVTAEGLLDLSDMKAVELSNGELVKYRLETGDVLFNRTNSRELVGKTGMWDGRFDAVAASYFIRVRFHDVLEHPQHFTTFMNLPVMKRRLMEMARGAIGQANINAQELKRIEVPVPPIQLQRTFAARVAEIRELQSAQAATRRRLDDLFQSLLHRAFQGKL